MNKFIGLAFLLCFLSQALAGESINVDDGSLNNVDPKAIRQLLMKPTDIGLPVKEESHAQKNIINDNLIKREEKHTSKSPTETNNKQATSIINPDGNQKEYETLKEVYMQPLNPLQQSASREASHSNSSVGQMKNPVLVRTLPINALYKVNSRNYISESGVNAIIAPIKITGFVPEPGVVEYIWINNAHGIAFQLKKKRKTFQAIVTFESKKAPISVLFDVMNVPGRVIAMTSSVTGTSPLEKDPVNPSTYPYDKNIIDLMSQIVRGGKLDSAWQHEEKNKMESPYQQFSIKHYQHWYNESYSIKIFDLCSRSWRKLQLNEKSFSNDKTMAVTLTRHTLNQNECGQLIVMSSLQGQQDNSEENTFSPNEGKS